MTAFKVWTWHFNLFVAAMLLSNYTPKINMHKTNPRFSVTWILINLHISLNMEGHLVLASRGIMFYYVWIFFTKKYSISYHKYPPLPNQWWIQGRDLGGPGSPLISLFLDQTEARRTEKIFFLYQKVWMTCHSHTTPPPLISRSGSVTANTFNLIIFKRPLIPSTIYGAINVTEVRITVH